MATSNHSAAALVLATALISSASHAGDWSAGFGLGASDTSGFCDQFTRVTCDRDSDLGYRFFVGRDFGDHLRVEGFWAYLGSARVQDQVNPTDSATVNTGGVGVSAMLMQPLTRNTKVFARAGVMQTMIGEHRLERVDFMYESTSVNPAYGVGLRHRIGERWSVRGEWERFDIDAKTPLPIDMASISMEYAF